MTRSSKPAAPLEPGPVDVSLAGTLIGLIAFGVVMVYSASAVYASNMYGNGYHFLVRQTVFASLAFVVLAVFAHFKIEWLRKSTYLVLLLAVLLMLAVAIGLGRSAGGATRWLAVGPVNVQPAELAKLAMITGRPVKCLWTREEVFYAHRGRHPMHMHYRSGATRDGKLVASDAKILIDGGSYSSFGLVTTYYSGQLLCAPYAMPAYRLSNPSLPSTPSKV